MLKKIREIYKKSKFSRNTAPKILSLTFAIVFWIFVMDQVNPEMTRKIDDVHIELIGIQELEANGYEIMGERDFVVNVELKGRRNEVIQISKDDIQITADLGDLRNGLQSVDLANKIDVPDILITELSKDSVIIDVDAIIRQPIDVIIVKEGSVPTGYFEEVMLLSPQQVFVKGPESYIETIDSIRGVININNATSDISKDLAVVPVDKNGETVTGIEVETNYVTVTIPVTKVIDVPMAANYEGQVKEGYELTAVTVVPSTINVRGTRDEINDLKFIETNSIPIAGADESFDIYVTVERPDGIIVNQYLDEVKVSFTIEEIITKEFTFDYTDITFINMDSPLRTNINELEGQVLLRVSAVESVINELSKNDLGLYIDAELFEPGEINASIELNKSNDFNSVEILPSVVDLIVNDINDIIEDITEETDETTEETDTTTQE